MNCPKAVICQRSYSHSVLESSLNIWKLLLGAWKVHRKLWYFVLNSFLSLFTVQLNDKKPQRGKIYSSVHESRIQGTYKEKIKNDFDFHFNHSHNNCDKTYFQRILCCFSIA